jgi:hypothetical protein
MDFTKDHKNRVNSLLMERWGYGKIEEASEEALGSPGADSKFSCGMKGGTWKEPDGPCIFSEAEELEEMQGHPGKCCDMAHPDDPSPEGHKAYMARITMRLGEDNGEDPKNVTTFVEKLSMFKTQLSTLDDPKEVLSVVVGFLELIIENNPTDFTDGEKKRVYLEFIKFFRAESQNVGKKTQPEVVGSEDLQR